MQWAVRRNGGTNAGAIHLRGKGIPAIVIGVPGRYIHTHHGILDLDDYAAAIRLVTALVERFDAAALDRVLDFS